MLTDFRKQGKDVFGTIIIPTTPAKRREQVPVDTEAQLYTETHNCCDSTHKTWGSPSQTKSQHEEGR